MFKGEGLRNGGAPHGEGAPRGGIRAFWVPISSKERRNKKIASGTPRKEPSVDSSTPPGCEGPEQEIGREQPAFNEMTDQALRFIHGSLLRLAGMLESDGMRSFRRETACTLRGLPSWFHPADGKPLASTRGEGPLRSILQFHSIHVLDGLLTSSGP